MEFQTELTKQLDQDPSSWIFDENQTIFSHLETSSEVKDYEEVFMHMFKNFYDEKKVEIQEIINECNKNIKVDNKSSLFENCSHLNMKYIFYSFMILSNLGKLYSTDQIKEKEMNIIELGGGYGGLCFYIHRCSTLFGLSIDNYTMINKGTLFNSQQKYLSQFSLAIENGINKMNEEIVKEDDLTNLSNKCYFKDQSYLISLEEIESMDTELIHVLQENIFDKYVKFGMLITRNFVDTEKLSKKKSYLRLPHIPMCEPEDGHHILMVLPYYGKTEVNAVPKNPSDKSEMEKQVEDNVELKIEENVQENVQESEQENVELKIEESEQENVELKIEENV